MNIFSLVLLQCTIQIDTRLNFYNVMKGYSHMKNSKKMKRIVAASLTGLFLAQQSMLLSVVASDITGVTGNNGVYNINPKDVKNGMGFRHYNNFNLSEGDIANLIYGYNGLDYNTFVNLVDGKININGIVNTMKGNNFYNGKAVFISPNGMVVGASGVLNVGSLGVYAPDQNNYKSLDKEHFSNVGNYINQPQERINGNGGDITINGKVLSAGGVDLIGGNVNIGKNGGVVGGIKAEKNASL